MIAALVALGLVFLAAALLLVWLLVPFVSQIADDKVRAVQRQQDRLRLTAAGGTVRR